MLQVGNKVRIKTGVYRNATGTVLSVGKTDTLVKVGNQKVFFEHGNLERIFSTLHVWYARSVGVGPKTIRFANTHAYVCEFDNMSLEGLYYKMQGGNMDVDLRSRLRNIGASHTSMSVGDVVVADGQVYVCASIGFKLFEPTEDDPKSIEHLTGTKYLFPSVCGKSTSKAMIDVDAIMYAREANAYGTTICLTGGKLLTINVDYQSFLNFMKGF